MNAPPDAGLETLRRQAEAPAQAAAADRDAVAADFAAAFEADPVFDWFLAEGAGRPAALTAFFRLVTRVTAKQKAWILRPASGGAAALWMRSEDMGDFPLGDELAIAAMLLKGCGLSRFPRVLKIRTAMDAHHPTDRPHDYLYFLGVRPEHQGKGIGSRLLRAHTDRLDAAGRAAFLETGNERTLSLYRSAGFEVTGDYRPAPDGPILWTLWREPKAR